MRVRFDVEQRRAQLIELGLAEFVVRSYDDISIDRIAQAAGIAKGLLYHYFPTKHAFYVACVSEAAKRLLARLELPPDTPPFDRLNEQVDRYLQFVRLHGPAFSALMRNHAGVDRELTTVIDAARAKVLAYLTTGLREVLPDTSASPLILSAFQGWIGLVERASIAWVESYASEPGKVAGAAEVRELLVQALFSVVRIALRTQAEPPVETKTI